MFHNPDGAQQPDPLRDSTMRRGRGRQICESAVAPHSDHIAESSINRPESHTHTHLGRDQTEHKLGVDEEEHAGKATR